MVLCHLPRPFLLTLLSLSSLPYTSLSWNSTHGDSLLHTPPHAVSAAGPILQDRPFVVVWNMPTDHCQKRYNIHLNLGDFDIVENQEQRFQGQVMIPVGCSGTSWMCYFLIPVKNENIFDI